MKRARALAVFTVTYNRLSLRVRVLPSEADVDAECRRKEGRRQRGAPAARAFFDPPARQCCTAGTIVIPANGRLAELIPHEVVHAVMHRIGNVSRDDDERLATAVGILSARVASRCARLGIGGKHG